MFSWRGYKSIVNDFDVTDKVAKEMWRIFFLRSVLHPLSLSVLVIGSIAYLLLLQGQPEIFLLGFISIQKYYSTFIIIVYGVVAEICYIRYFRQQLNDKNGKPDKNK